MVKESIEEIINRWRVAFKLSGIEINIGSMPNGDISITIPDSPKGTYNNNIYNIYISSPKELDGNLEKLWTKNLKNC